MLRLHRTRSPRYGTRLYRTSNGALLRMLMYYRVRIRRGISAPSTAAIHLSRYSGAATAASAYHAPACQVVSPGILSAAARTEAFSAKHAYHIAPRAAAWFLSPHARIGRRSVARRRRMVYLLRWARSAGRGPSSDHGSASPENIFRASRAMKENAARAWAAHQ